MTTGIEKEIPLSDIYAEYFMPPDPTGLCGNTHCGASCEICPLNPEYTE